MKTVLITDDHPIFRAGLRQIVEEEGYEVVAEAGDGNSCITCLEMIKPDIVILDLAMPGIDGYGVLDWLSHHMPLVVPIVISMHSSRGFAIRAKKLGARAFIAKEDASGELHKALLTPAGRFYLSASVGGDQQMPAEINTGAGIVRANTDLDSLTPAETRVLELVGQSMTSRQIGQHLNLSHRTIQTHRQRIIKKLELHGPNCLQQFVLKRGL